MDLSHPRFRTDLVAQPLEVDGQRFIDVTDPDSATTFRFYEAEYSVACAMDGRRDIGTLVQWAKAELGLDPSPDEVQTVVRTLGELGYLTAGAAPVPRVAVTPVAAPVAAFDDDELGLGAPGAPAAAVAAPVASANVELGDAGASPMAAERTPLEPVEDMELGVAGSSARFGAARGGVAEPSLRDFDQELGPAGEAHTEFDAPQVTPAGADELEIEADVPEPPAAAEPRATLRPTTKADSDEDGPTNLPQPVPGMDEEAEVSVDLSDHLELGADEVKEAVRASKVMSAVEVPQDLLDELEGKPAKAPKAKPVPKAEAKPEPKAEAKPEPKAEKKAEKKPEKKAEKKPERKPEPQAATAKEPAAKPAPEKKSSAALVLLFILLLGAAAAAAYYFLVLNKDDGAAGREGATSEAAKPRPKPAPPPRVAVLAEAEPEVVEVGATMADRVTWLADDGSVVEEGDVVAKMRGHEGIERELARDREKLEKYTAQLDEAKASGSESRIKGATRNVERKTGDLTKGEEKLAPLLVRASQTGTVKHLIALKDKVDVGAPIVAITASPSLTATFDAQGKTYQVGGPCVLSAQGKKVECAIESVEGGKVTVKVPSDAGLAAGEKAQLE